MKQYAPQLFIFNLIAIFMSALVYFSNEIYYGQYLGLLFMSYIVTAVILGFAWFVGWFYDYLVRVCK